MDIQLIFDTVIDYGFYKDRDEGGVPLMCVALERAEKAGVISQLERDSAKHEISKYLRGFGSLGGALWYKEKPWQFEHRLAIYKDWANKPAI